MTCNNLISFRRTLSRKITTRGWGNFWGTDLSKMWGLSGRSIRLFSTLALSSNSWRKESSNKSGEEMGIVRELRGSEIMLIFGDKKIREGISLQTISLCSLSK